MNRLAVLLAGGLFLTSCFGGKQEATEAELSAFGPYVNHLDSTLQGKWFTRMGVSADADSMLSYLRHELPRNGLDTTAFFIPQIAEDLHIIHTLAFDSLGQSINEVLTRLDHNLSKAYVEYSTGQRYGFMRPDKVLNRLQTKPDGSYVQLFDHEVKKPDYAEAEQQMASDSRMEYLLGSQPAGDIYQKLRDKLEQTTDTAERRKLAINMERCRWQLAKPEGSNNHRQVLVNIPSQQLWAVGGDSVLNMRICCGAYTTRTPLLSSTISYLQVNPDWIIPQKIVETDITRHAGDSSYFARNHYYIIERSTGDTLRAAKVSAAQLRTGRLRVGQKGGAGNSLGRMVSAKAKDDPMPDGEFAEFKEKVRFIIDNNPSGINFDVLTKELLSIAEKEIREKIASELQSMWEEKKDEWIGDNASRSQMAQGYDTGYSDAIKVIKEQT